jgi:hypothetical protein
MERKPQPTARGRRGFLKTAGLGAAAAGLAGIIAPDSSSARAQTPARQGGYRETEHVKRVYELARKF